jgi:hypothetical protein
MASDRVRIDNPQRQVRVLGELLRENALVFLHGSDAAGDLYELLTAVAEGRAEAVDENGSTYVRIVERTEAELNDVWGM